METEKLNRILRDDDDVRRDFLTKETTSDSESDNKLQISFPKKKEKKEGSDLLSQLVLSEKQIRKLIKKNYKLKNEIDVSEVTSRYLKLDLSNAQLRVTEIKEEIKAEMDLKNKIINRLRLETIVHQVINVVFLSYIVYSKLY